VVVIPLNTIDSLLSSKRAADAAEYPLSKTFIEVPVLLIKITSEHISLRREDRAVVKDRL
jgi:hypothetical protein